MRKLLLALALCLSMTTLAFGAEPFFAFHPAGKTGPVPSAMNGWHNQFEKNGDYGETWFFMVQTDEGGILVSMISITNLGLHTFDGRIDAQFYPPNGKPIRFYKELSKDDVGGATGSMDAHVGSAHVWGNSKSQHMTISDSKFNLKLNFDNVLGSLMFGSDGTVYFYKDKNEFDPSKSAVWATGLFAPRAKSAGTLTANGQTYNLSGSGYGDHSFSSIKIPSMMKKWFSLRAFDKKYTVIFQDQYLSDKFGGKKNSFGVFGVEGQSYPIRNFVFKPTGTRKDAKSGYALPTAFDIEFKAGPYTVKGTAKEGKMLDGIDVLAQVNAFVRAMIKAFYTNPYVFRFMDQVELDITGPDGQVEHISNQALVESNFF